MTKLGDYYNEQEAYQARRDMLFFGTSFLLEKFRKWYNPMRWILGKRKLKRLDPIKCTMYMKDWRGVYRGGGIV